MLKGYMVRERLGTPGLDNVFVEQLKHFGPRARSWLLQVFKSAWVGLYF